MNDQKIEILTDWVKGAFNRTGGAFNVNKSIEECYGIAKDYLPLLAPIAEEELHKVLLGAEIHYFVERGIPTAMQIKNFWSSRVVAFSTEQNLPEKLRSSEFQRLMDLAGDWIKRGGRRVELTDEVLKGIGVIIGEFREDHRQSYIKHWQGITGRKIEVIK